MEMYGRLDVVGSGPIEAATSLNSTMVSVSNFYCFPRLECSMTRSRVPQK